MLMVWFSVMNQMDRISARLICIVCVSVAVLWAGVASGTELYIPEIKATTGQSINIPVMIDQIDNLAGVKMVIKYNAEILTFKKAVKTKHTSSLMHIANNKKPGLLIIVMAGAKGIKGCDFSILTLNFETKKGLTGNHTAQITFTEVQLMSDQLKNIKCTTKVNPITISGGHS